MRYATSYRRPVRARRPVVKDAAQLPLLQQLAQLKPSMSPKTVEFAGSLVENFNKYGRLSDRQMFFVEKIISDLRNPPKQEEMEVSVERIVEMFAQASLKMKRIKVVLKDSSGQKVQFKIAGPSSKYAGQVMISDGGPFGEAKFFGRIDMDGKFVMTKMTTDAIKQLVVGFAADPEAVASKYGRETGSCCFCCKGLKDDRSVAVGYGPVCANRFGLQWGVVSK